VSGRVRCSNGQGQAPHMGANGTNMVFLIVFTLTGRRGEFPARGDTAHTRDIRIKQQAFISRDTLNTATLKSSATAARQRMHTRRVKG